MFTLPGYRSPWAVRRDLYLLELERLEDGDFETARRNAERALVSMFYRLRFASVLLPDGRVVEVDDNFLTRINNKSPFRHWLFDIATGEVGTTSIPYRVQIRQLISDVRRRPAVQSVMLGFILAGSAPAMLAVLIFSNRIYSWKAAKKCRPYLGGHLMIHQDSIEAFKESYYEDQVRQFAAATTIAGGIEQGEHEEERCARLMVDAHDELALTGGKLKKGDARERFGETVSSVRAFIRAWELARRMRPELGEGGRPKNSK